MFALGVSLCYRSYILKSKIISFNYLLFTLNYFLSLMFFVPISFENIAIVYLSCDV